MKANHLHLLSNKFQVLSKRLQKLMKSGRFHLLSLRRRNSLLKRWRRYHLRLSRWRPQAIGAIGLGLYMVLTSSTCNQFTEQPYNFYLGASGGFSKPVFADLDGDGDLEAFVGGGAQILFFENNSSEGVSYFQSSGDQFGIPRLGDRLAPVLVDIDGDGDIDVFLGEADGNISFFENTGTSTAPNFVLDLESEPFNLYNVGYHSVPTFADIDGDGDFDAFVGVEDGSIYFFENVGDHLSPSFTGPATTTFSNLYVDAHAAPMLIDIDGDGDLDAFVGDADGGIRVFNNSGSSEVAEFTGSINGALLGLTDIGTYSAPAFVDIDNDGDMDAFVGDESGTTIFFAGNNGEQSFTPVLEGDLSNLGSNDPNSHVSFMDVDMDGDLDVFRVSEVGLSFFYNEGSPFEFSLGTSQSSIFGLYSNNDLQSIAFADLDGDGDLDAFVGTDDGFIFTYENRQTGYYADFETGYMNAFDGISVGTSSKPVFIDIDGDGDLDAFVGEANGNINFFRNVGDYSAPNLQEVSISSAPFGLSDVGTNSSPSFIDVDGDGDFDAFVGNGNGDIIFFENTGSFIAANFVSSSDTSPWGLFGNDNNASPAFADIDLDGDMDAFVGQADGEIQFFENKSCRVAHVVNHALLSKDVFITDDTISSRAIIHKNREVIFSAELGMTLDTLFEVREGGTFYGLIDGCPL